MSIEESLEKRRSIYGLSKELPEGVDLCSVESLISHLAELVPDAFNMRSQRVIVVMGEKSDKLWDAAYDAFDGRVAREKMDAFKAGVGTVLFYTDADVVKRLQEQYPVYADNFPIWAQQSNGMLQISVWSALSDLGIGANLQHYNPVIDAPVAQLLDVPDSWSLVAQMPFGGIVAPAGDKGTEDIRERVRVVK